MKYLVGQRITYALAHAAPTRTRRAAWCWLVVGVGADLTLLVDFKYANFMVDKLAVAAGAPLTIGRIVLSIGISFYTFTQIAFLVETYRSTSISEFWRRWHVSLSNFLRDYLYIALGGKRHGAARRCANLAVTMFLRGLWHGAAWTLVVWGALHGAYLMLNHGFRAACGPTLRAPLDRSRICALPGWAATMLAVMAAWVFFRAHSVADAASVLGAMAGADGMPAAGGPHTLLWNAGLQPQVGALWCGVLGLMAFLAPNCNRIGVSLHAAVLRHQSLPAVVTGFAGAAMLLLLTINTARDAVSAFIEVVAGVLVFLLAAEALLRLLSVSSATMAGRCIDPHIQTCSPNHPWRYATSWDLRLPQRLTTDGHGFVSDHDFARNERALALVGDSFVESASLYAADRPAAQLKRALGGGRPVYAMGAVGTALLGYAERVRFAHQQFGIRDFVVLMERGDVRQTRCDSGNVHSRCLGPVMLAPVTLSAGEQSTARRWLRESALAQYLVSKLKLRPTSLLQRALMRTAPSDAPAAGQMPGTATPTAVSATPDQQLVRVVDAVAAAFFERIRPYAPSQLVIVLDSDRAALRAGHATPDVLRSRFITLARAAAGAVVVNAEPLFSAHFRSSTLSLDIGPRDGYFNRLGVKLIANATAREIRP